MCTLIQWKIANLTFRIRGSHQRFSPFTLKKQQTGFVVAGVVMVGVATPGDNVKDMPVVEKLSGQPTELAMAAV